ncbi:MAG: hypothetical protein EBQ73_14815, partial [Gammaproteobacteria bacterium]|nr:hypothetical protein [Gammaproteobacteria bacterium]
MAPISPFFQSRETTHPSRFQQPANSINKLTKVAYKRIRWLGLLPVVFLVGLMPTIAQAHRGAPDEADACVTRVGFERV